MSADPETKKKNQNIQNYLRNLETYGYVKIENFLNKKQVNNLLSLVNNEYEKLNSVKKIQYKGITLQVPINSEKYLEITYGPDWKTPKKDYIWYEDACNLKRD